MAGISALAAAYVLSQFYRSFLAVLTPVLQAELGASNADLALASGAWFLAFALMQFIVGVALDRYGPRLTAAILLLAGGAGGALLFAAATTPAMIVAAMALIGIGCSPVLMASFYIFAHGYEPARLATLSSLFIAVGLAGNVLGAAPLAAAAEAFGWRIVLAGLAVATALCALAILALVRNPQNVVRDERNSGFAGFLEVLAERRLWPILPLMIVAYSVVAGLRGLWAGPYFADVFAADSLAIGQVTLWMAIAMIAGTVIYGPLDRRFNTRKWVSIAGLAVVIVLLVGLSRSASFAASGALFVALGFFGVNYAVLMTHARAFYPPHLIGRGVTLMNFFSIGGVGLMQWATGRLMADAGPGDWQAYSTLFIFYALVLGVSVVIYLFSRDAKPNTAAQGE